MANNPSGLMEFPRKPSMKTKLGREVAYNTGAIPTAIPTTEQFGVDVSDWLTISVDIHPSLPNLLAPAAGWNIVIVPWWYKKNAELGSDVPQGQWYCGDPYAVSLDGDPRTAGPMLLEFPTDSSERFHVQIVDEHNAPGAGSQWMVGIYGLIPRPDTDQIVPIPPMPPHPIPLDPAETFFPMAYEQGLYTNLRGDFTATRTAVNQITLTDVPMDIKIDVDNIVAVGRKPNAVDEWEIQYRGKDLHYDFVPATGILTLAGLPLGATDLIAVWVDNRPKARTMEQDSDRSIPVNVSPMHVTIDGRVLNDAEIGGGGGVAASVMLNMAEEGYRRISVQVIALANVTFAVWGTNDPDRPDIGVAWADVTLEAMGAGAPIAAVGMYESIIDLPYKRLLFYLTFVAGVQSITLAVTRVS